MTQAMQNETMEGIMDTVSRMGKTDKIKLVNLILASIKYAGNEPTGAPMPVYEGLQVFAEIYRQKKGVSYDPNGKFSKEDFKHMRELLVKISDRLSEGGTLLVTDALRIGSLKMFLQAVCEMKNQWYFENRFYPYALNKDFDNLYTNLKNNSDHARRKAAFDYL